MEVAINGFWEYFDVRNKNILWSVLDVEESCRTIWIFKIRNIFFEILKTKFVLICIKKLAFYELKIYKKHQLRTAKIYELSTKKKDWFNDETFLIDI